jgi:small conductance mechanosensitive channel
MKNDWFDPAWIDQYLIPWGTKIILALAIFIIGKWVASKISQLTASGMRRAKLDEMLVSFLSNMAYWMLLIAVILAAVDQLGVNITSLLAIVGAAGLAVGLALKDSLSNFASGVMLVIFRPFKVGDFVEAAGVVGKVDEIKMFATIFRTPDNRQIIVPNSSVYGGTIVNFNAYDTRRIDLTMGISYEDDIDKARTLMMGVLQADERILKEPEPVVLLTEMADSSINFWVRPWVNSADYWVVRADVMERIKAAFDANNISIPYPQTDVHIDGMLKAVGQD